jgi:L-ascorbate metabolism protein UlaG (beta-lactamase superfamily)
MGLAITWLGHSTFLLALPSGQRILTDPWLGNPRCPEQFLRVESLGPVDLVLVSHGHDDHSADVIPVARATGAAVVCIEELNQHFTARGLRNVLGMNIGGTQDVDGVRVTMTMAVHSGSARTSEAGALYLGGGSGFVVRAPETPTIYFAGDTGLFGDMRMIGEVYRPEIAFLPIGDRYTMGPDTAAIAAKWLGVRQVVPMHWGTFPVLTGTPSALRACLGSSNIEVLELIPGGTAQ